jgi:hypothetical protein
MSKPNSGPARFDCKLAVSVSRGTEGLQTRRWRGESGANSSRAAGPTPPIKGRFHRRSDEFLESIKKGVETPEKGRNAGEKLIPQGQAGGGGIKNQRINPMH